MASRYGFAIPPGSSRRPDGQRCALRPARIRQVRAGGPGEGRKTPVPRVLLSATLAGPAPSGSTGTSRLCQGCSRPPRHHADQAALSYSDLLRQATGEGLSPPHGSQRLTAQTKYGSDPVFHRRRQRRAWRRNHCWPSRCGTSPCPPKGRSRVQAPPGSSLKRAAHVQIASRGSRIIRSRIIRSASRDR
jgi:hypothetical protein